MDQAIAGVEPVKENNKTTGYNITVANLEKMPMPIILQVKTKGGKTDLIKVPVDVWMKNTSWIIRYPGTDEVESVTLDPNKVLPDSNPDNNTWSPQGN